MKAKFVGINGRVEDSSYISFKIENGVGHNSIGDQVWFSEDGTELEVTDMIEEDILEELYELFEPGSRRALRGALMRMDVNV